VADGVAADGAAADGAVVAVAAGTETAALRSAAGFGEVAHPADPRTTKAANSAPALTRAETGTLLTVGRPNALPDPDRQPVEDLIAAIPSITVLTCSSAYLQ
jgi:hypothetical protein